MTDRRPPAGLDEDLPRPRARPGRVGAAAALLAAVAALALWAAATGGARLDTALLGESVEARSAWLTAAAVAVSTVGSTVAMALLAVLTGLWCCLRGRPADAVFVVGAAVGASALFRLLKVLIDRPRPPAATRLVFEDNESLPSGHATMAAVVVGSLVLLAWAARGVLVRAGIAAAAAAWVVAVGASRVYLGVHWFSDVVAGWLVGAAWLTLCATAWTWWRRRAAGLRAPRAAS